MNYDELYERLLALPGMSREKLVYILSNAGSGKPVPTGYSLVRRGHSDYAVFQGDGRGGVFSAAADDGVTPLAFGSESEACEWIWQEIMWGRDRRERRARERDSQE